MILHEGLVIFSLGMFVLTQVAPAAISDQGAKYALYGMIVTSVAGLLMQVLILLNNRVTLQNSEEARIALASIKVTTAKTEALVNGQTAVVKENTAALTKRLADISGQPGDIDAAKAAAMAVQRNETAQAVAASVKKVEEKK